MKEKKTLTLLLDLVNVQWAMGWVPCPYAYSRKGMYALHVKEQRTPRICAAGLLPRRVERR
jgi:hypothetical protein